SGGGGLLGRGGRFYTAAEAYQGTEKALATWGLPLAEVAAERAARLLRQRPREIQDWLVAILHFCHSRAPENEKKQKEWLRDVLAAADSDLWRQQIRQAVARADVVLLEQLVARVDVAHQPPAVLVEVANEPLLRTGGMVLGRNKPDQRARLALLRRAKTRYPQDFWLNMELGWGLVAESIAFQGGMVVDEGNERSSNFDEPMRYFT